MNKLKRIIPIVLSLLLLSSCSAAPAAESSTPKTVAVLFSSFADIWQLAGGEVAITVGESVERGICEEGVLLVDDGAGKTIDTELLLSYQPDLVIGSADIAAHSEAAEVLETAGIPCKLFRVETFEDYLAMLQACTDITGNQEAYQTYGTDLQCEIDSILQSVSGKSSKKVLFIRSGSGASSAKAKTARQHFAAKMLEDLGAFNIADNAPVLLDGLSVEEVLIQDPDYIFISTMGDETAAKAYMDSVLAQPAWAELTAVREQHYTYLSKELFQYKPNARWAEAYRTLAALLYEE